ncbi:MAG: tetratricopeptide repeat protein [Gammaproteobacteria bacterium]|nr:tetratricopeptide repeat protein [Gammaproteobacteria bacterium]
MNKLSLKFSPLALVAAISLSSLSACSTSDRVSAGVGQHDPVASSVSPQSQLMYEIMAAELAGRRGMLGVAAENYLSASQKTSDARVAERATKLAIFGRNWEQAAEAANRWSELAPDDLEARQILAQIHLSQGNVDGATKAFDGLITHAEDTDAGMLTSVSTLLHDTNHRAALSVMKKINALYPDNALAEFGLARLLLSNNEKQPALEAVERSLAMDPDSNDAILLKGQVLSDLGRAHEGFAYIEQRLVDQPDNLFVRLGLARLLVEAGQYDRASGEFEKIARLAPDDANAMFSLGLLALESKRTAAAEHYLERVIELGQYRSDANYYIGRIADNRQEYEKAVAHYEQVEDGENVIDAQIRSAEIYGAIGQLDKGRDRLHRLRMINTDPELRIRLILSEGRMLREATEYEESLAVFEAGLEEYPDHVELLYAHALTAEHLGLDEEFESDLRRVIEIEPENAHALNALGYFLVDRGKRLEQAERYLNKAISLLPDDPAIIDSLGWLQYRKGRYEEAIALLSKAFAKLADPEIAAHLGEVLWVSGDEKSATEIWNKGLAITPDDVVLKGVMERYIQ